MDKSTIPLLTKEQKYVIECLLAGNNIFLTGGGGVGKSFLISCIYNELANLKRVLHDLHKKEGVCNIPRIKICAMTGCAAILLGNKAKTLHSWAGIGLGKGTINELFVKIRRNAKSMRNWLCTDLLIIDEVSMMNAELLDKLNGLAKKIRGNSRPFGGIQVMFVGDFYQLPPVSKSGESIKFAFESDTWKETVQVSIELSEIKRQKDEIFQKILNEARIGELSKESCKILRRCQGKEWRENKIRPTLIFPRRAEVEMINRHNFNELEGKRYKYTASLVYDGKVPIGFDATSPDFLKALEIYDSDAGYLTEIELAVGAQIMLIANISPDEGLVNGSRGVILDFCQTTKLPRVEFVNGVKKLIGNHAWPIEDYEFVMRSQIPLRLGYANTSHKSQGSTIDSALIDIGSGIFEYGQAYVSLSRVKSLDSLYVYDFDPTAFKAHPRVKEFYKGLLTCNSSIENKLSPDSIDILYTHLCNLPSDSKNVNTMYTKDSTDINIIKSE